MAGKRRATSDLNHDNWEQEEDPEEAGTFKRASQEELNRRIIKTAKRRKPVVSEEDSNKKSAFANFTALSKVSAPSPTSFSFLSKLSGNVTNEETKELKKLHENGRNEVDQGKNKINDNKSLDTSNMEMSGEENTNDNSGETDYMGDRITKEFIENSSQRVNESTNNEIGGDADQIVKNSNNKTDEPEEFTNKKNIDSETVVSKDNIGNQDNKCDEALNDNSEKKDTNNK